MKQVQLTQGKVALVDDEDFEFLNQWKWYAWKAGNTYYAVRNTKGKKRKSIKMHRVILGLTDPKILSDHKDRNGLNNQKCNLRSANRRQNNINSVSAKHSSSKYLGVALHKRDKKWYAKICKNYKAIHLGVFKSEEEAALAYNKAAIELHGEFANLNNIPG